MKKLIIFLLILIVLLQYRLWFSDGGVTELSRLETRLTQLREQVKEREERNASLEADVRDLKEGDDAIEERARQELGMIRNGEIFVQIIDSHPEDTKPAHKPAAPTIKGK